MNKKIRKLMEKHNLPESIMTLYGLEIERITIEYSKHLEHHKDTTVGLWATDRPELINDPKKLLFEITE